MFRTASIAGKGSLTLKPFSRDTAFDPSPRRLPERLHNIPARTLWIGGSVLAVIVGLVGWLLFGAFEAKSNLEHARSSAAQSKDALLEGNAEDAIRSAEGAQVHAHQARAATHSLPWNILAAIPVVGSPLRTTQQIADVVSGLADDVLLPTAKMGAVVSPDKLISGTRIDLGVLRSQETRLSELSTAATDLNSRAQAVTKPAYPSVINQARSELQDQTSRLASLLTDATIAAKLAPPMLGADGPRTYLMAFQTNAEARGTGGLVGAFALLRFDNGAPSLDTLTTNLELQGAKANVDLGPEFNNVYGWMNPYTDFRNSNVSAHFPYAAKIWSSMWAEQSGSTVDGVIALDPIALSFILKAIGPVTLPSGEVITDQNVVELTQSTAYIRYPTEADQPARKEYLQTIAREIAKKATAPISSPRKLLDALGRAAGEGRLAVWSASPSEQALLERTPLAHIIPDDSAPYAQVVVNNLSGTKMDYFLEREIEYDADKCDSPVRNSTITVRLTNTGTETSLPPFYSVTGTGPRSPHAGPGLNHVIPIKLLPGTMLSSVRVVATEGATLMSVTSNGKRALATVNIERQHPTYEVQVAIPPGQTAELEFRLLEPTAPGEPRSPIQPLIDEVAPQVSVPAC